MTHSTMNCSITNDEATEQAAKLTVTQALEKIDVALSILFDVADGCEELQSVGFEDDAYSIGEYLNKTIEDIQLDLIDPLESGEYVSFAGRKPSRHFKPSMRMKRNRQG